MTDDNVNNGRPVHTIRYGNVSAAIWIDNSQAGYFYHTTFTRSFRDGAGEWGDTTSFDDRDLPALSKAAADAHSWIYQQKADAVTTSGTDESGVV